MENKVGSSVSCERNYGARLIGNYQIGVSRDIAQHVGRGKLSQGYDRTFGCYQCKKKFPDKVTCNNHIWTDCLKRFRREECKKGFNDRSNLRCYLRIHAEERLFHCDSPN